MKKKILFATMIIGMFLFMPNVKALSFDIDITNIEDKGQNGAIEKIDLDKKQIDLFFEDTGDEAYFSITLKNVGEKAGILKSITISSPNDKIEYTDNIPEGGLAFNKGDEKEVEIKAKLKSGASDGTTNSSIKINYDYQNGSCPEGEILSNDESKCSCQPGGKRNDQGVCVGGNPGTYDNIRIFIILFAICALALLAIFFIKIKFKNKKIVLMIIGGVIALSTTVTVLAEVLGPDKPMINPITKSKSFELAVSQRVKLLETWDGECSLETANLTAANIFEGGSGTESDPYTIKTPEQLSCFAASVSGGNDYSGKYIKQIKNIKLNEQAVATAEAGNASSLNLWKAIGKSFYPFSGTYDGGNYEVKGAYITKDSGNIRNGLFGLVQQGTIKNVVMKDTYINDFEYISAPLIGEGKNGFTVKNVKTYGKADGRASGLIAMFDGNNTSYGFTIEDVVTNVDVNSPGNGASGVIDGFDRINYTTEPNVIFKNVTNNGNLSDTNLAAGIARAVWAGDANVLFDNVVNNGDLTYTGIWQAGGFGGLAGYIGVKKLTILNSSNTGNFNNITGGSDTGGIIGTYSGPTIIIDNCFNTGNFAYEGEFTPAGAWGNIGGIIGGATDSITSFTLTNSYNEGNINAVGNKVGGLVGAIEYSDAKVTLENLENKGNITNGVRTGGIVGSIVTDKAVSIDGATNSGEIAIKYDADYVGGFSGYVDGNGITINEISNTGNIKSNPYMLAGYAISGLIGTVGDAEESTTIDDRNLTVTNSFNTGNIIFDSINVDGVEIGVTKLEGITKDEYDADVGLHPANQIRVGGLVANNRYNLTIKNSYNTGSISHPAYALGGLAGVDVGTTSTITDSYNTGDIIALGGAVGGLFGQGGPTFTRCYNTGDITMWGNINDNQYNYYAAGIVSYRTANLATLDNVYNEGNIHLTAKTRDTSVGGFCFQCGNVTDSYNRGNITVEYGSGYTAGIVPIGDGTSLIKNTYNSGIIRFKNSGTLDVPFSPTAAGIVGPTGKVDSCYNLGDIIIEDNDNSFAGATIGGISNYASSGINNCVNAGNITVKINKPLTIKHSFSIQGIGFNSPITNSFNAGVISIDDSALATPISEDRFDDQPHSISIGEITYAPGANTGNKFNTDPSHYALGLAPNSVSAELSEQNGLYTTDPTPDILSIINGNNAFEIKSGDTLPTLKAFNN